MKTAFAALAALTLLGARPAAAPAKLELKVITASPEGFLVNSTLITGARDAVLIDAAFTRADARRIVEAVRANLVEEPSAEHVDLANFSLLPWQTLTVLVKIQ